jgi:putative Holliday junction resolvase
LRHDGGCVGRIGRESVDTIFPIMRFLAFDLGEKRSGVAAGDDVTCIVSPVQVIQSTPPVRMDALLKVIATHKPDAIVIGVPLNMDDTEGPAARAARAVGAELASRSGLPVHFQDERLTTYAADQAMAQSGRTHKRKKELRDALAAVEILRDYFDAHRRT